MLARSLPGGVREGRGSRRMTARPTSQGREHAGHAMPRLIFVNRLFAGRGRRVTFPPSRPRRYQNLRPNPARSLAFCAPGWRVTWPSHDPSIPALLPSDPGTCTPRVARDIPVVRPLILVAGLDIVAADHARQRDSPAPAEPVAGAPDAVAVGADTASCIPSVSSSPSLLAENTLGTPCTAWNNPAASAALCRVDVHLSRRCRGLRPGA